MHSASTYPRPAMSITTGTRTFSSARRRTTRADAAQVARICTPERMAISCSTLTGERAGDAFGSTVGGYSDSLRTFIVVGAPAAGSGKTGRTYVYEGLSKKPKFIIESDSTGRALGAMFVSVMGDVNGDGVPDIYASDFTNGAKGPSTGRIYVHSGRDGKRLLTLTGEGAGEGFGIGPGKTGDVDHDGHADLVVGSWQYSTAATSGGRVYLYSGRDGHLIKTYTDRIPGRHLRLRCRGPRRCGRRWHRGLSGHRRVERRARQSLRANLHRVERSEVAVCRSSSSRCNIRECRRDSHPPVAAESPNERVTRVRLGTAHAPRRPSHRAVPPRARGRVSRSQSRLDTEVFHRRAARRARPRRSRHVHHRARRLHLHGRAQ